MCKYSKCICFKELELRKEMLENKLNTKRNLATIKKEIFDPWQRLYDNYTNAFMMKTISRKIQRYQGDELDFVLSTIYQQNKDLFADKCEIYYQPITINPKKYTPVHKRDDPLKQSDKHEIPKHDIPETYKSKSERHKETYFDKLLASRDKIMHKQLFDDHPLIIGGISSKIHPSSIKLMNSSHHSPQTNAGYVRQDRDGNVFQY